MSETKTPSLAMNPKDAAEIKAEALAMRYCLQRSDPDEKAEALQKLNAAALHLVAWVGSVKREADKGAALDWPAALAILDRKAAEADKAALTAVGMDLMQGADPAALEKAFTDALANQEWAGTRGRIKNATALLAEANTSETPAEAHALMLEAYEMLTCYNADEETTLADVWTRYLENRAGEAGPLDVLRLDPIRGSMAAGINANLGTRAGLEPGQTFILGGAPEAGKTSLAALFAVDAIAQGVPVLFLQLELSREETLEHLQAQRPDLKGWPCGQFWNRGKAALPSCWKDLLTVPRWPDPDAEAIRAAMINQARRRDIKHACKGLVIVDYVQLLTMPDRLTNRFEELEKATSRLAKAAAESKACLLLLSQLNKKDQGDTAATGTALAGADFARMAHRVALLQKATADGKACGAEDEVAWERDKGEARLLIWRKARGVCYTPEGHPSDSACVIWNGGWGRGFNSGEHTAAPPGKGVQIEY